LRSFMAARRPALPRICMRTTSTCGSWFSGARSRCAETAGRKLSESAIIARYQRVASTPRKWDRKVSPTPLARLIAEPPAAKSYPDGWWSPTTSPRSPVPWIVVSIRAIGEAARFDSYIFIPTGGQGRVRRAACIDAIRSETALVVEPWPFSTAFVGDSADIGLPDELGVFGEKPALVTGYRRPPSGTPCDQLVLVGD
jgi:hypothetical protein